MSAFSAIRKAFGGRPPRAPAAPEGVALYAVGDVHGRLDLLDALLRHIQSDAQGVEGRRILVMLGDYIDRGPESAGVIERLLSLQAEPLLETVCLRGNHEQALLDFLDDPGIGPAWMGFGGAATLDAYGVRPPGRRADKEAWRAASDQLAQAMPTRHRMFLEEMQVSYEAGDYVFVHAGLRPGVRLADQDPRDLMTIREPFLSSANPAPGRVVVFGHTPADKPRLEPGKIGLDTGAYATNVLTGVRLIGTERQLFQAALNRMRMEEAV